MNKRKGFPELVGSLFSPPAGLAPSMHWGESRPQSESMKCQSYSKSPTSSSGWSTCHIGPGLSRLPVSILSPPSSDQREACFPGPELHLGNSPAAPHPKGRGLLCSCDSCSVPGAGILPLAGTLLFAGHSSLLPSAYLPTAHLPGLYPQHHAPLLSAICASVGSLFQTPEALYFISKDPKSVQLPQVCALCSLPILS